MTKKTTTWNWIEIKIIKNTFKILIKTILVSQWGNDDGKDMRWEKKIHFNQCSPQNFCFPPKLFQILKKKKKNREKKEKKILPHFTKFLKMFSNS